MQTFVSTRFLRSSVSPAHVRAVLAVLLALGGPVSAALGQAVHIYDAEPVFLENLVVSASPVARTQADVISSTAVLAGAALQGARQATLGETLSALPGVSSTYFGPGSSRPVVRGLSANRVRVLANSTDTLDASNNSPDHAVAVEPFLVKRIEVVRGPAALLYGSTAVGGVVNVIDHRIESALPDRDVSGVVDAAYTDNGRGYAVGSAVDVALGADRDTASGWVLHLDGYRREADDLRVPGRSGQEDGLGNPVPTGRLFNSALDTRGGSVGLSRVSEHLDLGVNFNGFNTAYGVPFEEATETVEIELRQRRVDAAVTYKRDFGVFEEARIRAGFSDYRHTEIENGAPGTVFNVEGIDSRFELVNGEVAGWAGAVGVQIGSAKTTASGDEAFLPTHGTDTGAMFVFQELERGRTTWQVGARVELRRVDADPFENIVSAGGVDPLNNGGVNYARIYSARSDRRTTVSGSLGAIHALSDPYKLAWSASYTERAPTGQELYADGPHHGTHAYEIGDALLRKEKAFGYELGLRRTAGFVTGSVTGFFQFYDGYIFEQTTGNAIVYKDDDSVPGSGDELALDEYRFVQRDVLFYGFETEAVWHLHSERTHALDLITSLDYVRARERGGDNLPRIPPLKGRVALDWRVGNWSAGADLVLTARQSASAPGESDTDGYALLGASLGYCLRTRHATFDFFVRASNLADEEARLHTSFLKDIAPLPGRAFTAGVRASF